MRRRRLHLIPKYYQKRVEELLQDLLQRGNSNDIMTRHPEEVGSKKETPSTLPQLPTP